MNGCEVLHCLCLLAVCFGIGWYGHPFTAEWLAKVALATKDKP